MSAIANRCYPFQTLSRYRFELAFKLIVDHVLPAANPILWEAMLPFWSGRRCPDIVVSGGPHYGGEAL